MAQETPTNLEAWVAEYWLTHIYIPEPDVREWLLGHVEQPEVVRKRIVPAPLSLPTKYIEAARTAYVEPPRELREEIVKTIASSAALQVIPWLIYKWKATVKECSSPPPHGAAHYTVEEEDGRSLVTLRPKGFDLQKAYRSIQEGIRDAIDEKAAVRYTFTQGLTHAVLNGSNRSTELLPASRRYAYRCYLLQTLAYQGLLEDTSTKGQLYLLERLLWTKPGGWPGKDETSSPLLEDNDFASLLSMIKKARTEEGKARRASLWGQAAQMYEGRLKIEKAVRIAIRSAGDPALDPAADSDHGPSKDQLFDTLYYMLEELDKQPSATNYKEQVGPAVAKRLVESGDTISVSGVRTRLSDYILPTLSGENPDLDLPRGISLNEWRNKKSDIEEALERWGVR